MNYTDTLEAVSSAMEEFLEAETAEVQMERRVDSIIRELDELCAFAANPETADLVQGQRIGVGQIITRAQLIGSFLMARQPQRRIYGRG